MNENYDCSFCGKNQNQVKKIIAGPNSTTICDECILRSVEIIFTECPPKKKEVELRKGQKWYIKHKGASTLSYYEIEQVTEKTVSLINLSDSYDNASRYSKDDIEFIEKVKK